jgi:hypothetical protein
MSTRLCPYTSHIRGPSHHCLRLPTRLLSQRHSQSTLKMEAALPCETSVSYRITTRSHKSEDRDLSLHRPVHHRVQNGSGAHPASYPMGTRSSSLGVMRPGREADHSPPYSAEVKECVELYLHSPIRLHGVVLSQAQGLYLYLLPL